ncbi:MAG: hypothetical protein M5U12_26910 [Verrucomicrobia bacterium]|nr:hypothetical protein [Verrucomicrobiota bacterium]
MDLVQHRFDLSVTRRNLALEVLPVLDRLLQREEMFLGPSSAQRLLHLSGLLLPNLHIAQPQQPLRSTLAGQGSPRSPSARWCRPDC